MEDSSVKYTNINLDIIYKYSATEMFEYVQRPFEKRATQRRITFEYHKHSPKTLFCRNNSIPSIILGNKSHKIFNQNTRDRIVFYKSGSLRFGGIVQRGLLGA